MPDPKSSVKTQRPAVGEVRDLRVAIDAMIGPKQIYPHSPVEHGKDGWSIFIDEHATCGNVWISWDQHGDGSVVHVSRLDWENVRYLRYWPAKREAAA